MWAVCFLDVRGLGSSPEAGKTGVTWGLLHFPLAPGPRGCEAGLSRGACMFPCQAAWLLYRVNLRMACASREVAFRELAAGRMVAGSSQPSLSGSLAFV